MGFVPPKAGTRERFDARPYAERYRPLAVIGRGSAADVYLAVAEGSARATHLVVTKRLRPALAADPDCRRQLETQARVLRLLSHPNVVRTLGVDSTDGHTGIVMEFLDGQSLEAILERLGQSCRDILLLQLRAISDTLTGLHYAHDATDEHGRPLGLIHRDVSPSNVFVTYDGTVKLMDFGIAEVSHDTSSRIGPVRRKLRYISPEQAEGIELDRRTDIFSAGVMLWEAIAGEKMAPSPSLAGAPPRAHRSERRDILRAKPDAPPALVAICRKALATDRSARFATAADMNRALCAWLDAHDGPSSAALGTVVRDAFALERARVARVIEDARDGRLASSPAANPSVRRPLAGASTTRAPATAGGADPVANLVPARHHAFLAAPPSRGGPTAIAGAFADAVWLRRLTTLGIFAVAVLVVVALGFVAGRVIAARMAPSRVSPALLGAGSAAED